MAVFSSAVGQATYQIMNNETKQWMIEYVYVDVISEEGKIEMSFENSDVVFYWTITALHETDKDLTVFLFNEEAQKYFHMKVSKINNMILIEVNGEGLLFRHISNEYLEH